jgi:hypothetical protein
VTHHTARGARDAYCRYVTLPRLLPRALASLSLLPLMAAAGLTSAPAHAAGLVVPVQCETGDETVLPWDDVAYDLRGTCGVVRVTGDDTTVTMPTATRLVVDGAGSTITAKSLGELDVVGAGTSLSAPSVQSLAVSGAGSTVTVSGLVERAELTSTSSSLSADTINVLRLRGSDTVQARKAYRTRITGSDNVLGLTRADRLVLTGARNAVTVARGRTTVRDRGAENVLDLRPRRR